MHVRVRPWARARELRECACGVVRCALCAVRYAPCAVRCALCAVRCVLCRRARSRATPSGLRPGARGGRGPGPFFAARAEGAGPRRAGGARGAGPRQGWSQVFQIATMAPMLVDHTLELHPVHQYWIRKNV